MSAQLRPDSPVTAMAGIGPRRAAALASRGIATALDVVLHLPSHYQDWRIRTPINELKIGATAVVQGRLSRVDVRPLRGMRWRQMATGWIEEAGGERLRVAWFNLPPQMIERLPAGQEVLAYGKVTSPTDGTMEIIHPELHRTTEDEPPPVRPVYRLPAQVSQRLFARLVATALDQLGGQIRAAIPHDLLALAGIPSLPSALRALHRPTLDVDITSLEAGTTRAQQALALDEMFTFQIALLIERNRALRRTGAIADSQATLSARFLKRKPFDLTGAQRLAIGEIDADLAAPRPMNRLLMGDVGSGKTVVALWSALRMVESGYQALIMAPTEVLAEQHYRTFERMCSGMAVRAALLTGSTSPSGRTQVLAELSNGTLHVLFGTQALIQEGIHPLAAGLVVVDEQHRFGVFERARLKDLSADANVLMISATPIPRSLALAVFANLDVSILDEMPPGRMPVETEIMHANELGAADAVVHQELAAGHRAYYIVPLVEGEEEDPTSVAVMGTRLRRVLGKRYGIAVLHGRMRGRDKERVVRQFRDGEIQVLVSTTVVEVGIDVPEATAIVIMAAERYGLAQLHQLRGRVGRGNWPSRCLLIASEGAEGRSIERLRVLMEHQAGLEVAQEDLKMRGPGDLLGQRQSGALALRFMRFVNNPQLIGQARSMAEQWLDRDPSLRLGASAGAREALGRMLELGFSLADVG